jgi:DNA-binding NtrC family response regulator
MHGRTVLVVDDEPLIRFALADALQEEGYDVVEASNVLEAVAVLGLHPEIGAVVTDIDMPGGLSGLDLLRLVNGYDRKIVTIVTSGGQKRDIPEGSRFFAKPYSLTELTDALAEMTMETATDLKRAC